MKNAPILKGEQDSYYLLKWCHVRRSLKGGRRYLKGVRMSPKGVRRSLKGVMVVLEECRHANAHIFIGVIFFIFLIHLQYVTASPAVPIVSMVKPVVQQQGKYPLDRYIPPEFFSLLSTIQDSISVMNLLPFCVHLTLSPYSSQTHHVGDQSHIIPVHSLSSLHVLVQKYQLYIQHRSGVRNIYI